VRQELGEAIVCHSNDLVSLYDGCKVYLLSELASGRHTVKSAVHKRLQKLLTPLFALVKILSQGLRHEDLFKEMSMFVKEMWPSETS
jgi:hypothetical protein